MCLDVGLFGFILFGTLWTSWICMSVSFPRVENFSTITSSNNYSAHCSLLFLELIRCESWFPECSISFLFSLLFLVLLFTALTGWVALSLRSLIPSSSPILLFKPSIFFQFHYYFHLYDIFLYFLFIDILTLFILFLSLVNIFMTMVLNSLK